MTFIAPPPIGERSIVISVSVCLSAVAKPTPIIRIHRQFVMLAFKVLYILVTMPPIGERSTVMSLSVCVCRARARARACVRACVRVCVFVCPRSHLGNYTSDLHQIFVPVTYGRGSVLLWWQFTVKLSRNLPVYQL